MVRASGEVTIGRPPQAVFPWIAEPDLASRWQPDVSSWEITRRTEGMIGTEFLETLRGGGGSAEMRGPIVAYRPDELIAFQLDGPGVAVHARYTVEPTSTGALVRADVTVEPARPMPALSRRFIRWRMNRQLHRELDALRRLCSNSAPSALG